MTKDIPFDDSDRTRTLLDFLRTQGITIASSCGGEGVCKKCGIQNDWLTCLMTVDEFLKLESDRTVRVDYL